MPITVNADSLRPPIREMCIDIVRRALTDARPASERWDVAIFGPHNSVTRFVFCLGTDAPQSLTLAVQDDDASRALLYGSVCRFLRREWPGALAEH